MARLSPMFNRFLSFLLLLISVLLFSLTTSYKASARKFEVGGKDGWVVKPSENYNHWAQRNRFQVNDTLHFKYAKGFDSVLAVEKKDYDSCNTNKSLFIMNDGDSTFILDNSGLFFFISGNVENCKNGQKLVVLVLAVRKNIPQTPLPVVPSSEAPIFFTPEKPNPSTLASPMPSSSNGCGSTRLGGFIDGGVCFGVRMALFFIGFVALI